MNSELHVLVEKCLSKLNENLDKMRKELRFRKQNSQTNEYIQHLESQVASTNNNIIDACNHLSCWAWQGNLIEKAKEIEMGGPPIFGIYNTLHKNIQPKYRKWCEFYMYQRETLNKENIESYISLFTNCAYLPVLKEQLGNAKKSVITEPFDGNSTLKNPSIHRNIENEKKIVQNILSHLNGSNQAKEIIMANDEFEKLLQDVYFLIDHLQIQKTDHPIPEINISTASLRYSFYLIHKKVFSTNKIQDVFIDFLHANFSQFETWSKKTTKTKFSERPKKYPY